RRLPRALGGARGLSRRRAAHVRGARRRRARRGRGGARRSDGRLRGGLVMMLGRQDEPAVAAERTGLRSPVLVLNRSYQPVRITDAKQGFSLLYLGRARALDAAYEPHDFQAWAARVPREGDEAI